ncbi:MAG: class I SAM-dependent methyltransferase [Anaerolineae bacterium]
MSFYTEFASYYETIFPFSGTVYAFLRRYILPSHRRVLDVGCGPGHYAGLFALADFEVVGIDLDVAMIETAKQNHPKAEFYVLDMVDIEDLDRRFDAVYCIGNTAAHLNHDAFSRFLDAVGEVLRPKGPWILQLMNWDYVLEQDEVDFPVIEGEGDITFYRTYRDISETEVTFATRLVAEGETVFEDAVPLYPIRSDEIKGLHEERGFRLLEHVGSYGGAPFDPGQFSPNVFVFER